MDTEEKVEILQKIFYAIAVLLAFNNIGLGKRWTGLEGPRGEGSVLTIDTFAPFALPI